MRRLYKHISLFLLLLLITVLHISSAADLWLNPNRTLLNKKTNDNFLVQCRLYGDDGKEPPAEPDVRKQPTWTFKSETGQESHVAPHGRTKQARVHNYYTSHLMVTNSETGDAGLYTCTAEVGDQKLERQIKIDLYQSITFVNPQSDQHPIEGYKARINCTVTGSPKPEVLWFKKTKKPDDVSESEVNIEQTYMPRYSFEEDGQVLVIENFDTASDNGNYKCQVNQVESADVKEMNISVVGYVMPKIKFHSNATEILEGTNGEIACSAIGVPPPKYSWYKGNIELKTGDEFDLREPGLLRILDSRDMDGGQYLCKAYNEIGMSEANVTVNIFLKPTITPLPDHVRVQKDGPVEIACTYKGGKPMTSKWKSQQKTLPVKSDAAVEGSGDDGESVAEANVYTKLDEASDTITLHIRKATVNDAGDYQCEVENKAGLTQGITRVQVEHKPIMIRNSPKNIRAIDNLTAEMYCEVEALPAPTWKWSKGETTVVQDENINIIQTSDENTNRHKSTLTVKAKDNYATFKCVATNSQGSDERLMTIIKIEVSEPPQIKVVGHHPTKAVIEISNYENAQEYQKPTSIEMKSQKNEGKSDEPIDWNAVPNPITYIYDSTSNTFAATPLRPETTYFVAVRSVNEAGATEWQQVEATTAPAGKPMAPVFVSDLNNTECQPSACAVTWKKPDDDGGSDLTKYIVMYAPAQTTEGKEYAPGDVIPWEKIELPAAAIDPPTIELKNLKAKLKYKIRVYAENDVGQSPESHDLYLTTGEFNPSQNVLSSGVNAGAIVAIVIIVVLIIVLLVDVACYYVNQCGLLMCVCVNCCGKTPPEVKAKEVAMEEGKLTPDDKRPLRDIEKEHDVRGEQDEATPMINGDKSKRDTSM